MSSSFNQNNALQKIVIIMINYAKQQETLCCSSCSTQQHLSLLGCCLLLTCQRCLNQHSCETVLTILPMPSLDNRYNTSTISKCFRCSKTAQVNCVQCNNKQFCFGCSKIIHKLKYAIHTVSEIMVKAQQEISITSPTKNKKRETGFQESRTSKFSDSKENFMTQYQTENSDLKLETKISELKYIKLQIQQKLGLMQSQAKAGFGKLRTELDIKEQEVIQTMEQSIGQQACLIQKLIQNCQISKRALSSLLIVGSKDSSMMYLSKSKKISIVQELRRVDKRLDLIQATEYKYSDSPLLVASAQIGSLKPFERVKMNTMRVIDSTCMLSDRNQRPEKTDRTERMQSRSTNKNCISNILLKKTSAMASINSSRRSAFESPKESANSSLLTSAKFLKKKNNVSQFQVCDYAPSPRLRKVEMQPVGGFEGLYASGKLQDARSKKKRSDQTGNLAGPSPDNSYRKMR